MTDPGRADKLLGRVELAAGLLIVAVAVALHVVVLFHAGPLWRDEICSLHVAQEPSLGAMFNANEFDSFPDFWHILLRGWLALGLGGTDLMLRLFGMLTGLGIVVSLWWSTRQFGVRVPLISLGLFALAPSVLLYCDGLRAYGFGIMMLLFALGAIWRMVQNPTLLRILVAGALVFLSAHSVYMNSVFLGAIFLAVLAVGIYQRRWKPVLSLAVIGMVSAGSMLCYLPSFARISQWNLVVQAKVTNLGLLFRFAHESDISGKSGVLFWGALIAVLCVICLFRFLKPLPDSSRPTFLFILVATVASLGAFLVYLRVFSIWPFVWYFLPLLGLLVVLFDAAVWSAISRSVSGRVMRIAFALLVAAFFIPNAWRATHLRATNVDLVADAVAHEANKGDLVVVSPFYVGISFERYYHGPAQWVTIPLIAEDSRYHRWKAFKDKMIEPDPMRPVLDRIDATLKSGNMVWFVGFPIGVEPKDVLTSLGPAPDRRVGWSWAAYSQYWYLQALTRVKGFALDDLHVDGPPLRPHEDISVHFSVADPDMRIFPELRKTLP